MSSPQPAEQPAQSGAVYEATIELIDVANDSALLRLMKPVPRSDAQPLALATTAVEKGADWEGYGVPAATRLAGLLVQGRVQDPSGQRASGAR